MTPFRVDGEFVGDGADYEYGTPVKSPVAQTHGDPSGRFVQIAACGDPTNGGELYALDDLSRVWCYCGGKGWFRLGFDHDAP